jgi:acid phosphatase type 7
MTRWWTAALASIGFAACGGSGSPTTPSTPPTTPPVAADAFVAAAGDIGWCGVPEPEATAKLLDANPSSQVLALGDIAYPNGSAADFQNCYQPNWGRHKSRTRPVPGNHEYLTSNASPYFSYFGPAAIGQTGQGYYSFNLESWHIVALDSNISMAANSEQMAWLAEDLRANPSGCTLAYWHHPLFSSGPSQGYAPSREAWRLLYDAGTDVVLNGHDHMYERFAPQDRDGRYDAVLGIRQFVVGTGGAPLYDVTKTQANSEARSKTHGILRLTLKAGKYDWEFVPIAGQSFRDFGSGVCH